MLRDSGARLLLNDQDFCTGRAVALPSTSPNPCGVTGGVARVLGVEGCLSGLPSARPGRWRHSLGRTSVPHRRRCISAPTLSYSGSSSVGSPLTRGPFRIRQGHLFAGFTEFPSELRAPPGQASKTYRGQSEWWCSAAPAHISVHGRDVCILMSTDGCFFRGTGSGCAHTSTFCMRDPSVCMQRSFFVVGTGSKRALLNSTVTVGATLNSAALARS